MTMTAFEDQIVCVHCGYKYLDSWELNERCGERITCNKCNNEMLLHVNYEVTYATSKIPLKFDMEAGSDDGIDKDNAP